MDVFVEHDARTLAELTGRDFSGCDGVMLKYGNPQVVLASTVRSNPLSGDWLLDAELPGSRIVTWSGTLGDSLFESSPLNWTGTGRKALAALCDELSPQLANHERTICFQPHARHVLSDGPSTAMFLRERAAQPFEIAFAPAQLLEPSMVANIEDHLVRGFEMLGERCSMLILQDVRASSSGDSAVILEPLGRGVLPRSLVLELIEQFVPEETPIVLDGVALEEQMAWLAR